MSNQLTTVWGERIDPEHVLEEYPRPQMMRENWMNLNGYWEYAITRDEGLPGNWQGKILVPFSPEASLSGVNRQLQPDEFLHYRRVVKVPADSLEEGRWLLHFGAVDQICTVYVNGTRAGSHTGGYLAFSLDVTDLLTGDEDLICVTVRDLSDTSFHAKGKQSLKRGGMWYTAQSGIWQTVWMEHVPDTYISALKLIPDTERGRIGIKVSIGSEAICEQTGFPVHAVVSYQGQTVAEADFAAGKVCRVSLGHFDCWSPESPSLYDLELTMGADRVISYFAMRSTEVKPDENGILRFFLNGKPYYQNGLLDQGYYPDGLYTAPSDEALQYDIRTMKDLGFNMLRKHIKIEPDRWYYHCDRLGMLVWQDMVCGGSAYKSWFVTYMPNFFPWTGRVIKDSCYRLFSRENAFGRKEYYSEMRGTVRQLFNHPSIVAWVPFNEGWGQFDAGKTVEILRRDDPSRLIDEASGWFDQGGGDMYSIHNYFRKLRVKPRKKRVVALTECGGYSLNIREHSYCEEVYGYRKYYSMEELTEGIANLWKKELIPNLARGLSASVYTQVSDIEDEVNGLVSYDRKMIKVEAQKIRDINKELCFKNKG